MRSTAAQKILTWLLVVMGGAASLAFIAVVMPTAWIVAGMEWTATGPFDDTPLNQYLIRSASALYGLLGLLVLYLSRDVIRYLDLIVFVGWLTMALGALLTVIDFAVGMPSLWTWAEGPPTVVTGAVFVWLAKTVKDGE